MKKVYIQPEAQLLSLAALEDFLAASPDLEGETNPSWGDENVGGGGDDYNKWA